MSVGAGKVSSGTGYVVERLDPAADPGTARAVGELLVDAYAGAGYFTRWHEDPSSPSSYAHELRDVGHRARHASVLVARDGDGSLLGTMTVALHGSPIHETAQEGEAELRMLAVDPRARGRGVAHALLDASIEEARALGAQGLVLLSIEEPERVERRYTSRGFVRVPERDESWEYEGEIETYPHWRLDLTR